MNNLSGKAPLFKQVGLLYIVFSTLSGRATEPSFFECRDVLDKVVLSAAHRFHVADETALVAYHRTDKLGFVTLTKTAHWVKDLPEVFFARLSETLKDPYYSGHLMSRAGSRKAAKLGITSPLQFGRYLAIEKAASELDLAIPTNVAVQLAWELTQFPRMPLQRLEDYMGDSFFKAIRGGMEVAIREENLIYLGALDRIPRKALDDFYLRWAAANGKIIVNGPFGRRLIVRAISAFAPKLRTKLRKKMATNEHVAELLYCYYRAFIQHNFLWWAFQHGKHEVTDKFIDRVNAFLDAVSITDSPLRDTMLEYFIFIDTNTKKIEEIEGIYLRDFLLAGAIRRLKTLETAAKPSVQKIKTQERGTQQATPVKSGDKKAGPKMVPKGRRRKLQAVPSQNGEAESNGRPLGPTWPPAGKSLLDEKAFEALIERHLIPGENPTPYLKSIAAFSEREREDLQAILLFFEQGGRFQQLPPNALHKLNQIDTDLFWIRRRGRSRMRVVGNIFDGTFYIVGVLDKDEFNNNVISRVKSLNSKWLEFTLAPH